MNWSLPFLVLGVCVVLSVPLGAYLAWAMGAPGAGGLCARFDHLVVRIGGPLAARPQGWRAYVVSLLVFNALLLVASYLILIAQGSLPLNPDGKAGLSAHLAFNTAVSFTTNTNLQHYSGEQQLSYFSQLFVVMWLQFVSAATGHRRPGRALPGPGRAGGAGQLLARPRCARRCWSCCRSPCCSASPSS